ncbi:MAG: FkbM family methyltransferase [Candidatus Marinimicrobia bacterium]|jgi:FkbM family methyltransferase|nr:FkbM family methyltransferase [Candidatus Neomarinimicrobiota bacterium]MBT4684854.1 FkbM family methyltransferase [Candidatus Neomarinimicrobiota bacterium]MBT5070319.1 FkbM family methyltransferase [Candidatus Neomarinimicrobiota bacterium]MBT7269944.1 FkbM family methyltransferase [Candidatus Neomarinimicrobiota bacterium]
MIAYQAKKSPVYCDNHLNIMYSTQIIISRLWWGSFRRIFEYCMRKILGTRSVVISGPLKGYKVEGGLAQVLGIYEYDVQACISESLKKGNIFYDIGSNNGFFSILGSKIVGPKGKVYSFEPFNDNIFSLKKVLRYNAINNCTIFEAAISDEVGKNELFFSKDNVTPSLTNIDASFSTVISVSTIDTIIKKVGVPQLIKLDVEGAESRVLKGSAELLNSNNKVIWVIEIHDLSNEKQCIKILMHSGYSIKKIRPIYKESSRYPFHILANNL